jgi:hypothetical protein
MSEINASENRASSNSGDYDNLTRIDGIGAARQQWFRSVFNVRTFRDLAALSAEEIETRLKAEKKPISKSAIQEWLAQAAELAGNNQKVSSSKPVQGAWKTLATFVVVFEDQKAGDQTRYRTTVQHMEVDETKQWPGIEQPELCKWMLTQLGAQAPEARPDAFLPPAFDDRVQEVLAKVILLESQFRTLEQGASNPQRGDAPPAVIEPQPKTAVESPAPVPAAFSPQLQQVIAKARELDTETRKPASQLPTSRPVSQPLPAAPPAVPTGYSDKLQKILAKADRLEAQKKNPAKSAGA